MISEVANELWLEIFNYLPRDTLKDISLAHHNFCRITRPLLFAHFDFHPFALGPNGTLFLPSAAEVAISLERLEFWSSDEIAPLVRSCDLTPCHQIPLFDAATPYVLFNTFFERITRFTGLRRLRSRNIHFTSTAVANLCLMSSLAILHVDHFEVAAMITREDGLDHWIPLLSPEHLRELSITCNLGLFSENRRNLCDVGWGVLAAGSDSEPRTHHREPFPALKEYTGHLEALPIFLPRDTLTRVTLFLCSSQHVIRQLQSHSAPLNITSLDAKFSTFDHATLGTLVGLLPRLTELRIRIILDDEEGEFESGINSEATIFFDALTSVPCLRPPLQHFTLGWELEFDYDDHDDDTPSGFSELRDALVGTCPGLKSLSFDGPEFVYRWSRSLQGIEVETCVTGPEEVEVMRRVLGESNESRD
ncbi:hypothetical protein B0H13DRAFT_2101217 [Mycena leptocephala]|nr:hypothetical protein B0H13DRAFT_2101217 [Mycena leptocephala]